MTFLRTNSPPAVPGTGGKAGAAGQEAAAATDQPTKPASHDTTPPPALLEFMTSRWKPRAGKPVPRVRGHERYAARRAALPAGAAETTRTAAEAAARSPRAT